MMSYFPINNFMHLRILLALLSLLLSAVAFYIDDIINADAMLYVQTIQAFMNGGLTEMAKLYNWPFFSIVAATFSQLTHIPPELSAKIICTILFVLFTDALLLLSSKIVPSSRQLFIAAILILFFYSINNYREFIIRDTGYWAFFCYAFYQLMNFIDTSKVKHALLWQTFMIIATLFRVEGAILLVLIPIFLFFSNSFKKNIHFFLRLYSLIIIALIAGVIIVINTDSSNAFSKIFQITGFLELDTIHTSFMTKANLISQQILHPAAASYGPMVLFSGLVFITLYSVVKGLSIPYLILSFISIKHTKYLHRSKYFSFFLYAFFITLLILISFSLQTNLVTRRYSLLSAVLLFLMLLPTLCQYIDDAWSTQKKKSIFIIIFLLFVSMADTLISSNSKAHVKDVSKWAATNLPNDARILTINSAVTYYFNSHNPKATITQTRNIKDYHTFDYIILLQKKSRPLLPIKSPVEIIYKQSGNRDETIVYKVVTEKER